MSVPGPRGRTFQAGEAASTKARGRDSRKAHGGGREEMAATEGTRSDCRTIAGHREEFRVVIFFFLLLVLKVI